MERFNFGYSKKNIPLTNKYNYKLQLIDKIEAVIKRMRWKAIFMENDNDAVTNKAETFNLKSTNCPKQVKELIPFENDLLLLAKNIKFRNCSNSFQERMKEDIKVMNELTTTLTPADKTSIMYKVSKEQYNHLKHNAVTSKYKKVNVKAKEKMRN